MTRVNGARSLQKVFRDADEAVSVVREGDTVMIGGFGDVGVPFALIEALVRRGTRSLAVVSNNCGTGERGLAALFRHNLVRKIYASFPAQAGNDHFAAAFHAGRTELELVPQGTLVERIRAGGAGLGGFLTPTGVGTAVAAGKQVIDVDGRPYLLEQPLRADVALICAEEADEIGNLRYLYSARNFNPVMAMAAAVTVAEVARIVPLGTIEPDDVHTPSVFVDRIVARG